MKWIDNASEKRKILQKQYPLLFKRFVEILFKHDLMGIDYEVNPDEYEPEVGTIIPRLSECSNYVDARKVIHEEFTRWFYDDVGDEFEYSDVAKEIWDVWGAFGMKEKSKLHE